MPRLNPLSLTPPETKVLGPRTFTDPAQPGEELVLTLRQLTTVEEFRSLDAAAEYTRVHVDGDEEQEALPLALPSGPVQLSRSLCSSIAVLEPMQVVPDDEAPYSLIEWVVIAQVIPKAFTSAGRWANEINLGTAKGTRNGCPQWPSRPMAARSSPAALMALAA